MADLFTFIKDEIIEPRRRRSTCAHEGETHEYCSRCGADLRTVTSYECALCSLLGRTAIYPAEKAPDFCTRCGAPKFTFIKIRKKRGRKKDVSEA
jgi:hypothetical protein